MRPARHLRCAGRTVAGEIIPSVTELHVQEEGVDISRYHVLDEVLAERCVFRGVVEGQCFSCWKCKLVVVEVQVVAVDRQPQVFVVLIADTTTQRSKSNGSSLTLVFGWNKW